MLFNSFVFLLCFLPVTYLVFWSLRSVQLRYIWLTVTGYVFYGYWNPWFCFLMAFSTMVSYLAGLGLLKQEDERTRRCFLVLPIAVDLALLAFFKYANFGLTTMRDVASAFGFSITIPYVAVILPVGISFYTFHTITYIVDAYRRTIRPTRNLFEFAAYVSLFSQLVAGPIVRFRQIEADLECLGSAQRQRWFLLGVSIFVFGLTEKVVIADQLAVFVDPALSEYMRLGSSGVWMAMLGYTFQLYFDFCGYSDMAVGLGYMFGLRIPQNFNSPYKALNPSDFWRRWHISLSTCLRDYLYIPLGGSRRGAVVTCRNMMITMLLGGLWHGANWTFVLWGAYHGALLVMYLQLRNVWNRMSRVVQRSFMFLLVLLGWVPFRSTDLTMTGNVLQKLFLPTEGELGGEVWPFSIYLATAALWATCGPNAFDCHEQYEWKWRYGPVLASALGICLAMMAGGRSSPFLYFQF